MTPLTAAFGMASIEGYFDEAFVVPPMVELLKPLAGEIDGVVVGCFDDTGVDALRAMLNVPVIGIAKRPCCRPAWWRPASRSSPLCHVQCP